MRYVLAIVLSLTLAGAASAARGSGWFGDPQKLDEIDGNSTLINLDESHDGCPILSPDGLSLYIASNRVGGKGKLDIWVSHRESRDAPFGDPVNLEAINTPDDEFCPTPLRGKRLMFVSRRVVEGVTCGLGDIYITRKSPAHGWTTPRHLPCAEDGGPNSALDEQGPSLVEIDGSDHLYFSRSSGAVQGDIFLSRDFGPASPVDELNSAGYDIQPNVRKDGREVVFTSNSAGRPGAQGAYDLYIATRESTDDPWSAPVNLGSPINTENSETRPSLSWDARTLLFGRGPAPTGAPGDVWVATR